MRAGKPEGGGGGAFFFPSARDHAHHKEGEQRDLNVEEERPSTREDTHALYPHAVTE